MPDVTLTISTESARAIQELVRFAEAEKKAKDAAGEGTRALTANTSAAEKFAGSLATMVGFTGGILGLKSAVGELEQYMDRLAKKANETQSAMTNFIGLQTAGLGDQNAKLAQLLGAKYGVGAKAAVDTVSQFQSAAGGDFKAGMQAAEQAFKLQEIDTNLTGDQARNILRIGMAQGLTAGRAAAITLKAADLSNLSLGEYAQAAPGAAQFKSAEVGAAAVTALSAGAFKSPEQMATGARQMAVAIDTENEFTKAMGKLAKKQGQDWAKMSEEARLEFIGRNVKDQTAAGFQAAGVGQVEGAFALQEFFAQKKTFDAALQQIRGAMPETVDQRINKILEGSPRQKALQAQRVTEAMAAYEDTWSQESYVAQLEELKRTQRGATLKTWGLGFFTDEEGKPRFGANGLMAAGEWFRGPVQGPQGEAIPAHSAVRVKGEWVDIDRARGPGVSGATDTRDEIGRLNALLEDNTKSNRELAEAMKGEGQTAASRRPPTAATPRAAGAGLPNRNESL